MATELPTTNGAQNGNVTDTYTMKTGLARMLKGGVIMDVVNAEQVSLACADQVNSKCIFMTDTWFFA